MRHTPSAFFFLTSLALFGLLAVGCGDDGRPCPTGTLGCECYPNRTCNGSLECGPAGRCERSEVDASTGDASGMDGSTGDAGLVACSSDNTCDMTTATRGYLCIAEVCRPCGQNADCEASAHYGAGATCEEGGRCQASASCAQVGCPDGGVCEPISGRCRDPKTCDQIGCGYGQLCQEATSGEDAECLAECEAGLVWNALDGVCDPVPDNCRTDWENSILAGCTADLRVCVEEEGGAYCDECFVGYVDSSGTCVPALTCGDLDCATDHRACVAEGRHTDAYCAGCLPGYGEHFGTCEQQTGATCDTASSASILAACAAQGRTCVEGGSGAACGPCITGRVENPTTGMCEVEATCGDLDCDAQHRDCEQTYNGHCTVCSTGYVEDPATGTCVCAPGTLPDENGDCETIRTCNDIAAACAAQGELCIEATDAHHATCRKCPEGQTWYEHQQTCLVCAPCTNPGETGQLYPIASQMGHCVCETLPGYYHSESGLGGTFACDKDGDGWISADARLALEAAADTAERDNARCTLRTIDRILLRNEWGEQKEILLSDFDFLFDAVPLYEPVNRDRDDKILNDYDYTNPLLANYAPPLGDQGRPLTAAELNPLTKACATGSTNPNARYADFNADGTPDVDDPGFGDTRADPEARLFAMFSYYLELYHGHYEAVAGSPHGRYVIEEKTRSLFGLEGHRVPLVYPPGRLQWRDCRRHTDADYSPGGPPYGFDFAQYGEESSCDWSGTTPGSWCGFNHHSQFKCLAVVMASDLDVAYPHHETSTEIAAGYEVNQCAASADTVAPDGAAANPSDPQVQCHLGGLPSSGSLVWGAAKYQDYGHDDAPNVAYVRGCVNECAESDSFPAEHQCQGDPAPSCRGLVDDYGKLFCYRPLDFVTVPMAGASFLMGSPQTELGRSSNETQHTVSFVNDYGYDSLLVTPMEITQDQFEQYMGFNPSRFDCGNTVCPVEQVTWFDALAFANVLSDREGLPRCYDFSDNSRPYAELLCADGVREHPYDSQTGAYLGTWCQDHGGVANLVSHSLELFDAAGWVGAPWRCDGYRLPTEAEWEYLARGSTQTALWTGDLTVLACNPDPGAVSTAWTCADGGFGPHGSGLKLPNAFGLYDVNGNVWEWTSDTLEDYPTSSQENPSNYDSSIYSERLIVARGGAWNRGVQDARSARREGYAPGGRNYAVGFRIVRTLFEYDYNRYVVVPTEVSWSDADLDCQNRGGHLASIQDLNEQLAIYKSIKTFNRKNDTNLSYVWLGLNDIDTEGTWVWSDGSAVNPAFWKAGEPNDSGGNEDCLEAERWDLSSVNAWNDADCALLHAYVCELPN